MSIQSHPLIRSFLETLAKELGSMPSRNATMEEISSHLFDTVERLIEEGTGEEQAVQQAIQRLGDPRKLGKALRAAHRPWYLRWFIVLPSSFALTCALAVVALSSLTEMRLRASEEFIRQQERSLSLFFKDQEALRKYSFLSPTERKSDVGTFLNTRVEWEGDRTAERYKHPEITLSEDQRKLLRGQDWIKKPEPKELQNFDLSWMAGLDKFDHWDIWATDGAGRDNILSGIPGCKLRCQIIARSSAWPVYVT